MITRSKLVEQLRDYQIRSHNKWGALSYFSPKPQISTRRDVIVAILWALLFFLLAISSSLTLYYRYPRISACIACIGILLPVCLKVSRQRKLARKRERRMLLPLSM
ncbi:hypothetical protein J5N97_010163 [Dioscorea zingiberensis]|uniref:Uncharacterized protein n=1 Tax=Dioscorea zingiberensis TaxID=325984 RepID=A0A9D5D0R9_9LILI|nr:hypothetical protein J5N97_010163 [Dioscorea zingiberensis]